MGWFITWKILSLLWQILNSIEQIIIVENGQIRNKQSSHLVTLLAIYIIGTIDQNELSFSLTKQIILSKVSTKLFFNAISISGDLAIGD